jgi:hypothetical protein
MRLLLALLVVSISRSSAAAADLTAKEWRQDLHVLATDLPRLHRNLFFRLPKSESSARYAGSAPRFRNSRISRFAER